MSTYQQRNRIDTLQTLTKCLRIRTMEESRLCRSTLTYGSRSQPQDLLLRLAQADSAGMARCSLPRIRVLIGLPPRKISMTQQFPFRY